MEPDKTYKIGAGNGLASDLDEIIADMVKGLQALNRASDNLYDIIEKLNNVSDETRSKDDSLD